MWSDVGHSQPTLFQLCRVQLLLLTTTSSCDNTFNGACAGTPLGDPIEVGALGQALSLTDAPAGAAAPRRQALALGSAKACFGHTEGAAGLTGLLAALQPLAQGLRPAVMHLRGLNPYVAAALGEWRAMRSLMAAVPRQPAACSGLGLGPALAELSGTSSFGMSGVNAHALLSSSPVNGQGPGAVWPRSGPVWRRARFWPLPLAHAGLVAAAAAAATAALVFSMDLNLNPALAFLGDCCVAGRRAVPAAALLEAGAAAAQAVLGGGPGAAWAPLLLLHANLGPAKLLHVGAAPARALPAQQHWPAGSRKGAPAQLECRVSRAAGALEVATGAARHLAASVRCHTPTGHERVPSRPAPGPDPGPTFDTHGRAGQWRHTLGALVRWLLPQRAREQGGCVATVVPPLAAPPGQFLVHPAALAASAALPCAATLPYHSPEAGVLASCSAFRVGAAGPPEALPSPAHATAAGVAAGAAGLLADVSCGTAGIAGAVLAPVPKLATRSGGRTAPAYQLVWQALALPKAGAEAGPAAPQRPTAPARWLVLSCAAWPLGRLCSDAPAWLSVRNIVFQPEDTAAGCAAASDGGSISYTDSTEQLEAAVTEADADQIFCVYTDGCNSCGARLHILLLP